MLIEYGDYIAMTEEGDEVVTADELHAHIQSCIFGRYEPGDRFDKCQEMLHRLVDLHFDDADTEELEFPE